jgi:hypothetical protein
MFEINILDGSVNVKAFGNDTFTKHLPTSNGSSSNNTVMAKNLSACHE